MYNENTDTNKMESKICYLKINFCLFIFQFLKLLKNPSQYYIINPKKCLKSFENHLSDYMDHSVLLSNRS